MDNQYIRVSNKITVGPQPDNALLQELAERGFKTIINLCNEGELGEKVSPEEEGRKAEKLGMRYIHLPVSVSRMNSKHVQRFCDSISEEITPVYVHCRLGQRSGPFAMIYHGIKRRLSPDATMEKAWKLGFQWKAPMIESFIRKNVDRRA